MNYRGIVTVSLVLSTLLCPFGCNDSYRIDETTIGDQFADDTNRQRGAEDNSNNGKFDITVAREGSVYATCNEGAMIINRLDEEYIVVVSDADAVDYFLSQSNSTFQTTVEYSGQTNEVTIPKTLPWMVSVVNNEDGSHQLVIRDFRVNETTGSLITSGSPGNSISAIDGGLKLVINGSEMTNSHSVTYYEVGSWFFEGCDIEDSNPTIEASPDVVADCNDGALVLERSANNDGHIMATVTDENAVEYFITQSESVQCEEISYSNETRDVCVQKSFHYSTTVTEEGTLVLDQLHANGDDYTMSMRDGASLIHEGGGFRLTLRGSEMTSSHTVSYYEVGNWLFDACVWY